VRGRTIYAVPDRVVYAYFDMLTRLLVESERWDKIDGIPLVVSSRDFAAVKLQWQAKAAAVRKDAAAARDAATKLHALAQEPGQHPFAQAIIGLQAAEADAFAAEAAGDLDRAAARLREAVAVEDSIDDLSQPPYPVIPANELLGSLFLESNRPAEALACFEKALQRTPNRPKIVFGLARAAQALGDNETARKRYQDFLRIWRTADRDRRELATATAFLRSHPSAEPRSAGR
jgi:tetratricopeptide (TPR) repeat protein